MQESCDEAENHLDSTHGLSQTILERAGGLRDERYERFSVLFPTFTQMAACVERKLKIKNR